MRESKESFSKDLAALAAAVPKERKETVGRAEVEAYLEGKMSFEEEERFHDLLVLDAHASRLLLEICEERDISPPSDDEENEAPRWTAMLARMENEAPGELIHEGITPKKSLWEDVRVWQIAALVLVSMNLVVFLWGLDLNRRLSQTFEPDINILQVDLLPIEELRFRNQEKTQSILLSPNVESYVLGLVLADPEEAENLRIEIWSLLDEPRVRVWSTSGLRADFLGRIVFQLRRDFLDEGEYQIKLYGEENLLAEYPLLIEFDSTWK